MYLCGGTFFTLVLEAKKQGATKTEKLNGQRDGFSEQELFLGVIKVMFPDYDTKRIPKSFKTNVSDYKSCKNNGTNLPFYDAVITAFDKRVKNDYQTSLTHMQQFVQKFLNVGNSLKLEQKLIKRLIALIIEDDSIENTDLLYVNDNGKATTKGNILERVNSGDINVVLEAFLLGVWHFAVVNRHEQNDDKRG